MAGNYKFSYSDVQNSNLSDSTARPLILLHGFMGCKEDWTDIIDGLKISRRCIAIDLPGHGDTKVNAEDSLFTIENTAGGIIELTDNLGIDTFDLLGYSMGGRLALYIAVHYPERVTKLILESSSPGLKTHKEQENRRINDLLLGDKIMSMEMSDFISQWYDMPLFKSIKQNDGYEGLRFRRMLNDKTGLVKSLKYMGTGFQPSLWAEWEALGIETLLIAGEYDKKYTTIANKMCKLNPNARLEIIADTGHNLHFERSDLFINHVADFLIIDELN